MGVEPRYSTTPKKKGEEEEVVAAVPIDDGSDDDGEAEEVGGAESAEAESAEAAAEAAEAAAAEVAAAVASSRLLPEGYKAACPPARPLLEDAKEGAALVGRRLMYNWPGHGWCEGQIKERNTKKGLKIDGDVVNFLVHYPVDDDTSRHVLSLDTYASDECAPPNSWFLLEEL